MCFVFLLASLYVFFFFFFNDTATTEIYTLSLHDALPIYSPTIPLVNPRRRTTSSFKKLTSQRRANSQSMASGSPSSTDRKSTRLNSSHSQISYAVFCLKKKKKRKKNRYVHNHSRSTTNAA